jgi:hypothetical protein
MFLPFGVVSLRQLSLFPTVEGVRAIRFKLGARFKSFDGSSLREWVALGWFRRRACTHPLRRNETEHGNGAM